MRIVIEIEDGKTTVTVDDEAVGYEHTDAVGTQMICFSNPEPPPDDGESYIGE